MSNAKVAERHPVLESRARAVSSVLSTTTEHIGPLDPASATPKHHELDFLSYVDHLKNMCVCLPLSYSKK